MDIAQIIQQLLQSAIGQAGIVLIVAEILDLIKTRMGRTGVWEDLGNFMKDAGTGVGKAVSGFIRGSKVEPVLADYIEKMDDVSDKFIDALIAELEGKKSGENEDNE